MTSNSASRIAPCAVVPFAPVVCTRTRASRRIGCGTEYPHSATSALPLSACRSAFASVWSSFASVNVASLDVAARRVGRHARGEECGDGRSGTRATRARGPDGRAAARERARRDARRRAGRPGRMHVPSDAFQGRSPEIAARDALKRLFTAVAARATLAETLEREGAEGETYRGAEERTWTRIRSGGTRTIGWRGLMARDDAGSRAAGLRVLEARETFANEVFSFEEVREMVAKAVTEENDKLMADYVKRMLPKM